MGLGFTDWLIGGHIDVNGSRATTSPVTAAMRALAS